MRRLIAFVAAGLVLAVASPALGKGAESATIDGDSLAAPIRLSAQDQSDMHLLVERAGFWVGLEGGLEQAAPPGDLGPVFTVTWSVLGGSAAKDTLIQALYPYAEGGPVTYTLPDQTLYDQEVGPGWFRAPASLFDMLVEYGLPATPPAPDRIFPWPAVGGAAALVLLLVAVTAVLRRRPSRLVTST